MEVITKWCKISFNDIQNLLKYFAKQPIETQVQILKSHREILFKVKDRMKKEDISIEMASYISLILSIKYFYAFERKLAKAKFEELTVEELRDVTILKLRKLDAKNKKQSKRDKLCHYWSIVKSLKKDNRSFRYIAFYLKKEHNFAISHSEIHKAWNEIEN